MKKLIFPALILSIALLASCSKSGVDAPPTPVLDTDVESLAFAITGETKELKITSNVNWDVVEIGEGITVTPIKGKGNATLSVTMPKNETYEDTPKSFKIKSTAPLKTITVTQIGILKGLIHVPETGKLASLLDANPSLKKETSLKITGTMNEADFVALIGATKATLETLDISELTITTLPHKAFTELVEGKYVGYPKLKTITLPAGVDWIGNKTFSGCSSLASITIPDGVTLIGGGAFSGCSSLASITIPDGVILIGDGAFSGCSSLTSITIPAGVTSIGKSDFDGCSSLASITIPAGVTSIGNSAFSGCSSLESITLPAGVEWIGDEAFSGCSSLTSIIIPEKVPELKYNIFYDCSSLTSIIIPKNVISIEPFAFSGCSALRDVTCLAISPPVVANATFLDTPEGKTLKVPAASVAAYKGNPSWENHFPGDQISRIADLHVATAGGLGALLEATPSLKTETILKITGTMNEADFVALKSATKATLEVLYISELTITALPANAFGGELVSEPWINNYGKLKTITLPTGLKDIGEDAFSGCSALTSIIIPKNVISIEPFAFYYCSALRDVTCLAISPPAVANATFLNTPEGKTLKVPAASVAYYKDSSWTNSFPRNLISGIQ